MASEESEEKIPAISGSPRIGRAEMEILQYVIENHPVSVRQVAEHIAETKGLTRTTVLNVMERLRKKGFLTRRKDGGSYQYSPAIPKPQLLHLLIGDFVERVLGGSLKPFTAYLAQDVELSDEELDDLKQLVERDAPKAKNSATPRHEKKP